MWPLLQCWPLLLATLTTRSPAELGLNVVRRDAKTAPLANRWSSAQQAQPTNAWFENILLCDPVDDPAVSALGLEVSCNVFVVPYVVWPNASGVMFAAPFTQDQGFNAAQMFDDTSSVRIFLGAVPNAEASRGWREDGFDDLTMRLKWPEAGIASTLARGSPFLTVEYLGDGATPLFESPQFAASVVASDVFGASLSISTCTGTSCDGATLSGTKFVIALAQSDETWVLYASSTVALHVTNTRGPAIGAIAFGPGVGMRMQGLDEWTGVLRAALLTNCTSGISIAHCRAPGIAAPNATVLAMATMLDAHAAWYP